MDDVDGEVGQKMRSAIKAKLTELGCYVDDELPDYVMVMVANKRTRSQMEDDLQLFLGDNTELFVNWLHQVLKKLQEVSAAPVTKSIENDKKSERTSKERKSKDKKDKSKKSDSSKKSKKKAKEKAHKKKDEKKKSKKKSKHEMIRPNIPPLLMNIEKESEPSITDVFAGQILKNHGVILETHRTETKVIEQKPVLTETKRPAVPIIDPATILSQTTSITKDTTTSQASETVTLEDKTDEIPTIESIIKETDEIEAVIEESKQKLVAEQNEKADSTDDEDFLNIRTEADELINDFGDDVVFKEITQPPLIETPPLRLRKVRSPSPVPLADDKKKDIPETLPQIELNLPKRPIRERLGAPTQKKDAVEEKEKEKGGKTAEKAANSPERNTPELEPDARVQMKSAKSRLGSQYERSETQRKRSTSDDSEETSSKRLTSRVSVLDNRPQRVTCASVVRVRPRPRVAAPASSLLLRAVADAHKSLLNIPPKVEPEPQKVKRALVLPMRRNVDPKKIVIQVPCTEANTATDSISDNVSLGELDSEDDDKNSKTTSEITSKEEYTPFSITKVIKNNEYVPSRTLIRRDDALLVETINIHNTTVDKDKGTQFIVTMDGYHPNAFLAKKLKNEGLLNDDEEKDNKTKENNKPEGSKTGVFRNINTDMIKDTENVETSTKEAAATPIVNAKELTDVISGSPIENIKDVRSILEKRKSYSSIDRPILEKRKRDASIEKPIHKKHSTDGAIERPILNKQKRDSSLERSSVEERKAEVVVEKQITESQASNIPTVETVKDKRKSDYNTVKPNLQIQKSDTSLEPTPSESDEKNSPPVKKRKASPIVFDVNKKGKETEKVEKARERTVSASSDSHVILTTASNTHKYDALPPLSQATRAIPVPAPVAWCRAFPQCRYGTSCAFAHPRCKFAAACTRRGCPYEHPHGTPVTPLPTAPVITGAPVVASHVVPAANYKSISAGSFANLCKYYPNCTNPTCHYYHPKPCRYGKACSNKLECNFYHLDVPGGKWKYST